MTGGGEPIWKNGRMLGYVAEVSNQVPSDLVKGSSSDCSAIQPEPAVAADAMERFFRGKGIVDAGEEWRWVN
jgi:hypothetical protein